MRKSKKVPLSIRNKMFEEMESFLKYLIDRYDREDVTFVGCTFCFYPSDDAGGVAKFIFEQVNLDDDPPIYLEERYFFHYQHAEEITQILKSCKKLKHDHFSDITYKR